MARNGEEWDFKGALSHPLILVLPILSLKHIALKMFANNDPL